MVLKAADLLEDIGYTLGGEPGENNPGLRTINEAGSYLCGMRPWKWLKNRMTSLDARASYEFVNADWDTSELELSDNQLNGYEYVAGDSVLITGGENVNTGRYDISGATGSSPRVLTLESEITTDGMDKTSEVDGKVDLDFLRLPDDFAQLDSQQPKEGVTSTLEMVTLERLLALRTNPVQVTESYFYGALAYRDVAGIQKPVIELWPEPDTDEKDKFRIFYGAKWLTVDDDSDTIHLPDWEAMESLMRHLVRAFARGYEDDEIDELRFAHRLHELKRSDLYKTVCRMDSKGQYKYGPVRNGHVAGMRARSFTNYLATEVSAPS